MRNPGFETPGARISIPESAQTVSQKRVRSTNGILALGTQQTPKMGSRNRSKSDSGPGRVHPAAPMVTYKALSRCQNGFPGYQMEAASLPHDRF